MNRYEQIWTRYEINEIGKNQEESIKKECVIDFYGLIHRIDINQFRFTDFYGITDWQIDIDFYRLTTPVLITGVMVYQLRGEVSIEHI